MTARLDVYVHPDSRAIDRIELDGVLVDKGTTVEWSTYDGLSVGTTAYGDDFEVWYHALPVEHVTVARADLGAVLALVDMEFINNPSCDYELEESDLEAIDRLQRAWAGVPT